MEHVLGFEEFWEVEFHTAEAASAQRRKAMQARGSGLRSIVMRDAKSGVKFANNEPWRPAFKSSQINIFHEDMRGDGIQHAALTVEDILTAVREMRRAGVAFMPTPATYYEMLPDRLKELGVGRIDEDVQALRELEILVDGGAPGSYLLQIFLKDSAGLYGDPEAGPFFYEIIQRKGDPGFGAGNFRALFESIEREQQRAGRT
jgi:4-hydroxyphenylpyruvate dioxygenase